MDLTWEGALGRLAFEHSLKNFAQKISPRVLGFELVNALIELGVVNPTLVEIVELFRGFESAHL